MSTLLHVAFLGILDVLNSLVAVRRCHREAKPGLSYRRHTAVLYWLVCCQLNPSPFFFFFLLEKDVKLEKNKLDSGGLRDCFLCRTHTHLCCLYKQRLQRLTDLTTIHRKLRGLTVSPGILWSRWKSAMTATLSCSPQCIHYCRL